MNRFDRLLDDAFPAMPVSDALRRRVALLPRRSRRPFLRPVLAGALGAGLIVVAAVLLAPRAASAQALIAQAEGGFSGHSRSYEIAADGERRFLGEGWYAPGKSRVEMLEYRRPFVQIEDVRKGIRLRWQPAAGRLDFVERASSTLAPELPRTIDPKTLAVLLRDLPRPVTPRLEDALLDGRAVKRVDLRRNGRGTVLYGEPKGLRLIAYEFSSMDRSGRPHRQITTLQPGDPPESVFRPTIRYEGRVFDAFAERERVRQSLTRPLATYPVPGGAIAVRRVAMNRRGDLFVLYTSDDEGYLPSLVTDDAGGTYVKGVGFQPNGISSSDSWRGYSFGGKPLLGAWYVRVGERTPQRITVRFRRLTDPPRTFAARHTQSIEPTPESLLDFMPFMSMGPASVERLETDRAYILANYSLGTHRWSEAERWARRYVSLTDPLQALLRDRLPPVAHALLARALVEQGKDAEAKREVALVRARAKRIQDPYIEETLRGLEARLATARRYPAPVRTSKGP